MTWLNDTCHVSFSSHGCCRKINLYSSQNKRSKIEISSFPLPEELDQPWKSAICKKKRKIPQILSEISPSSPTKQRRLEPQEIYPFVKSMIQEHLSLCNPRDVAETFLTIARYLAKECSLDQYLQFTKLLLKELPLNKECIRRLRSQRREIYSNNNLLFYLKVLDGIGYKLLRLV